LDILPRTDGLIADRNLIYWQLHTTVVCESRVAWLLCFVACGLLTVQLLMLQLHPAFRATGAAVAAVRSFDFKH
jgi:hypothetical protein